MGSGVVCLSLRGSGEEQMCGVCKVLGGEILSLPKVDPSKPAGLLLRRPPESCSSTTLFPPHGEEAGGCRVDERLGVVEPGEPGGAIKCELRLPC